ncbi:MAG TPA: biotin carboxylase N-terminal domain-containing protein [Kofleriaceae bacterium]|nr:biotin carboxylase N-terminal domain-containing protein [Kofleriaceae bacterium]
MAPRIHTIRRLLIANRGEIAARIARTCHAMGITTVAVFTDADRDAPHVRACDEAVRIGPAPARESYLAIDRLIAAARATGADAIHPGYGFLAENADFAAACIDAGLVFVGPAPRVIAALGSKERARELAVRAGVPVVPSFPQGAAPADLAFPVLIKASAGGGGKGMRIVRGPAELGPAIESCRRESLAAFGDDTLLVERYLERARHVEIQILGDQHGHLVHLFERECSVQRRHQKIIEESPSPAMTPELRDAMGRAALALAREVGYENAGTVELLLAEDGSFYFLEVNTRLQVEHPVTELVTGLDLVREQIRVAEGEPLGLSAADLRQTGHAIECRLYAEDPEQGFLPAGGRLLSWRVPDLPGLRVDAGVEAGSDVPTHYDPMLAKLIVHAPTRGEAARRLAGALERLVAQGVATNRELLVAVLRHPEFLAGRLDTHFLDRHEPDLFGRALEPGELARAVSAAALSGIGERRATRSILPELEPGWRSHPGPQAGDAQARYGWRERGIEVGYRSLGGDRFACRVDGQELTLAVVERSGDELVLEDEAGVRRRLAVTRSGLTHHVCAGGRDFVLVEEPRFPERRAAEAEGGLSAPMPGRVVRVLVAEGDPCAAGQPLVILEAMKMEHAVKTARAGRVTRLLVREGDPVEAGAVLVALEPLEVAS